MLRLATAIAAAVIAVWSFAPPALAYLDPGTGSTMLQGLIGGGAIAAGFIAYYWGRLRSALAWRRPAPVKQGPPEE
jgi:hypothetical protein